MSTLGPVTITYNSSLTRATFSCEYDLDESTSYRRIIATFGGYKWKQPLSGSAPSGTFTRDEIHVKPGETHSWSIKIQFCDMHYDPEDEENWKDSSLHEEGEALVGNTISFTIIYDDNGGGGGPGSLTESIISASTGENLSFNISDIKPVRDGYIFAGWLFPSGYIFLPGASAFLWASESGETYTAVAQWEEEGCRIYIGNGTGWKEYEVYIGNGTGWVEYKTYIGNSNQWEPE